MKCRICNTEIQDHGIGMHIKNVHDISYRQYVELYYDKFSIDFNNWQRCRICNVLLKRSKCCSIEHDAEWKKRVYTGKPGQPHSKKTKIKLSKQRKLWYKNGWKPRVGKKHTLETIKKISAIAKKRIGPLNGMYGKTHSPETIEKIFSKRSMNKLEQVVANTLDRHKIPYKYQFFLRDGNVCKSYDFKIKRKMILIEVDGDFWHGNPTTKYHAKNVEEVKKNDEFKLVLAKKRGFKVFHFWEQDIKKNPNIVIEQLEREWE